MNQPDSRASLAAALPTDASATRWWSLPRAQTRAVAGVGALFAALCTVAAVLHLAVGLGSVAILLISTLSGICFGAVSYYVWRTKRYRVGGNLLPIIAVVAIVLVAVFRSDLAFVAHVALPPSLAIACLVASRDVALGLCLVGCVAVAVIALGAGGTRLVDILFPIYVIMGSVTVTAVTLSYAESARRAERRQDALSKSTPDLLIVTDHAWRVLQTRLPQEAAPALRWAAGVSDLREFIPGDTLERLEQTLRHVSIPGVTTAEEFSPVHVPERQIVCEARVSNLSTDSRLVIIRDVSARAHVDRLKDEFISMVSHELRTPMTGIIGMANVLRGTELSDEQREQCDTIRVSAEALLTIINDILDISKMESGKFELSSAPFDLRALVEETAALLAVKAREKGLDVLVRYASEVPRHVHGDAHRVRQVLTNLVANAIKFTAKGHVAIQVEALNQTQRRATLRITVSDTGIGIPEARLDQIFEKFVQGDPFTSRGYGGSGLGLAIARELVELMGGTIAAENSPDGGARFWFDLSLPRRLPTTSLDRASRTGMVATLDAKIKPRRTQPDREERTSPVPGARVLVAEDDLTNQKVIVALLRRLGCEVDVASDGRETLEKLQRNRAYQLVFMDCQMPELDGLEVTRRFRRHELEQSQRPVPIVALTANAMQGDRERCLAAGMNDYVSKPVTPDVLDNALARWLPVGARQNR